jgi:hypothetical protein
MEQPNPEVLLERGQAARDRCVFDSQPSGGRRNPARAGDGEKYLQSIPIHAVHYCRSRYA